MNTETPINLEIVIKIFELIRTFVLLSSIQLCKLVKDGGFGVIFSSNSVIFECNYKRNIDISSSFETALSPPIKPIVGNGNLGYTMKVNVGALGGRTSVSVEPNHGFTQIYPRVIECKVLDQSSKNEVNLIHSMDKGAVCIDKSRFDAKQTYWYPKFAFDYRSFRYKGDSDTKESDTNSL